MNKDLEEDLDAAIRTNALCGTPVRDISGALEQYRVDDLELAASYYLISGVSRLRKNDLVKAVARVLLSEATLKKGLLCLEDNEWAFFCRAAVVETLVWERSQLLAYVLPERLGLLQRYHNKETNQVVCVVPDEIRAAFRQLMDYGFELERARAGKTHRYAKAAVNLYGIIGVDELISLLRNITGCQFDYPEFIRILHMHEAVWHGYFLAGTFLLHENFYSAEPERVGSFLTIAGGKPRFIPQDKVFLQYADDNCFERTPQVSALMHFLQKHVTKTSAQVDDLLKELIWQTRMEVRFHERVSFAAKTLDISEMATFNELAQLLKDIHNHTRLWTNKGHTPDEMFRLEPPSGCKPTYISRNSLCPCGSGKKYKRCCGRDFSPQD